MLNYKECSIDDFNLAMSQKNADVKTISDAHLYILYTKFKADSSHCCYVGTSYAVGLGIDSRNKAYIFKSELHRRGVRVI